MSDQFEFELKSDSFEEIQTKHEYAFKYLELLKKSQIILIDKKASSAIKFLYMNSETKNLFGIVQLSVKNNFVKNLIELIGFLKEKLISSIRIDSPINRNTNTLLMLLVICRSYSQISTLFCNEFLNNNGLNVIFDYLRDEILLDFYLKISCEPGEQNYAFLNGLIRSILRIILNLEKVFSPTTKQFWPDDSVFILLNCLKIRKISDNKLALYLAIAYICDTEYDIINEAVIPEFAKLMGEFSILVSKNDSLDRNKIQCEDSDEFQDICVITYADTEWCLLDLLKGLGNLAKISSKLSERIFFENFSSLSLLINNGNLAEKVGSLELLSNLCTSINIASHLKFDKVFYAYLFELRKEGIKYANEIISSIEQYSVTENRKRQVMISYNRDSRDACLLIKSELEKRYKVWIDVDNISGSSLESMANAIEESFCIIICLTEKYEKSVNCRAEADYANQLKKPLIPLIMQKNWTGPKPDDWLDKKTVDLSAMEDLCQFEKIDFSNLNQTSINNSVVKWEEKDVEKWISEKQIRSSILDNIRPCNGELLYELFSIKMKAPDYFYETLMKSENVIDQFTLRDYAVFFNELKKLFIL